MDEGQDRNVATQASPTPTLRHTEHGAQPPQASWGRLGCAKLPSNKPGALSCWSGLGNGAPAETLSCCPFISRPCAFSQLRCSNQAP